MKAKDVRVLIVGGGFSGVGAAIRLKRAGIHDLVLLEKAQELGGTWRDNTYPGCACDVPSTLYSYSFDLNPDWGRVFALQPEINAYLDDVARGHGVLPHVHFGCEVTEARWDEGRARWIVETTSGRYTAQAVVAAAGPLHEPSIPDLPGIDRFEGALFHSSRWDHDHDLDGERVAVVGTGASAIQFVPEIQPRVGRLHLFQRTAPWVLPKPDHAIPPVEKAFFRRVRGAQRAWRAMLYHALELMQLAQRRPKVMQQVQRLGLLHLRLRVRDPKLRAMLTPDFTLGCKRILMSNTYYQALQRENVEVVPHGVREIGRRSVVGADGVERDVDTIIFGTGFHATDPPIAERVRGRDGRTLAESWAGSPQAYLGTTVTGFPNLFLVIGPNTGNGHTSAFVIIEAQVDYIAGALAAMERERLVSVDVRAETQAAYDADVQQALAGTVWNAGGCQSWYIDDNGRNASIYPWTTIDLRRRTGAFDLSDYEVTAATAERIAA